MRPKVEFTKEQQKISRRNKCKARKFFGIDKMKPYEYDLHHINPSWRYEDIERYIQWNPEDLIVLTHAEHTSLHSKDRVWTEESRKKLSLTNMGHVVSEETREKLRQYKGEKASMYGKHHSEQTKKKIGEANKGLKNGANTHPEKNSFINNNPSTKIFKGTHYYNNGLILIRAKECPEGFIKGGLPRKRVV